MIKIKLQLNVIKQFFKACLETDYQPEKFHPRLPFLSHRILFVMQKFLFRTVNVFTVTVLAFKFFATARFSITHFYSVIFLVRRKKEKKSTKKLQFLYCRILGNKLPSNVVIKAVSIDFLVNQQFFLHQKYDFIYRFELY